MKIMEYIDVTRLSKPKKPLIFDPEKYAKVYEYCRRIWRYAPVEVDKICRIAEQLKEAGITREDVLQSDIIDILERFTHERYETTRNRDKRIYRAISRYKRCIEVGVM